MKLKFVLEPFWCRHVCYLVVHTQTTTPSNHYVASLLQHCARHDARAARSTDSPARPKNGETSGQPNKARAAARAGIYVSQPGRTSIVSVRPTTTHNAQNAAAEFQRCAQPTAARTQAARAFSRVLRSGSAPLRHKVVDERGLLRGTGFWQFVAFCGLSPRRLFSDPSRVIHLYTL